MTNDFLGAYKSYYQLRMQRYEGIPAYARSYASEKAIYEAIASCSSLEEFKDKLGNLHELNAVALIMDTYAIRLAHYESMQETVKAEGCRRILEKAASVTKVQELVTLVNEEENRNSLAITADTIQPFPDTGYLERREIWATADVPEKYKERYNRYAREEEEHLREAYAAMEKELRNWQPGWVFDFALIKEERHRRNIPLPDEVIGQHIQTTKDLLDGR